MCDPNANSVHELHLRGPEPCCKTRATLQWCTGNLLSLTGEKGPDLLQRTADPRLNVYGMDAGVSVTWQRTVVSSCPER